MKRLQSISLILLLMFFIINSCRGNSITADNLSQPDDEEEKGNAKIINLVCTSSGECILLYERMYTYTDYGIKLGPYLTVVTLSENGGINFLTNSSPVPFTRFGVVQEDSEAVRIIGWQGCELSEIWWFKLNKSLEIRTIDFSYDDSDCFLLHDYSIEYPRQVQYMNEITNYTLVGWRQNVHSPELYGVMLCSDGSILNVRSLEPQSLLMSSAFLVDADFNLYYANNGNSVENATSQLEIKKGSLYGTWTESSFFELTGTPDRNVRCEHSLLGLDGEPYACFLLYDLDIWLNTENYKHTFELVNLKNKTSLKVTFQSDARFHTWDALVDESSYLHLLINTRNSWHSSHNEYCQYFKVNPNGTIEKNTRIDLALSMIDTFYEKNHILSVYNDYHSNGFYLLDISTGTFGQKFTDVIPYISYAKGISWDFFPALFSLILVSVLYSKIHRIQFRRKINT